MVNIGFFQFSPQKRSVQKNISFLIHSLKNKKDCLIVLPEFFLSGYSDFELIAEDNLSVVLLNLIELTKKNRLTLIGSLPVKTPTGTRNRSYLIQEGILKKLTDKKNLYDREKKQFIAGEGKLPVIKFNGHYLTVCVCLDVIDSQSIKEARLSGADILCISGTISVDFLLKIAEARSLENQMVVVFSNRAGIEGDSIKYLGSSTIFFPDGRKIVAPKAKTNVLATSEIKKEIFENIKKSRKNLNL